MRFIVWDYTHYEIHGGKEVFVDIFVKEFLSRGHDVLLVTGEAKTTNFCLIEDSPGLERLQLPNVSILKSLDLFSIIRYAKTRVREFEPQILFSQSFNCISRILIDSLLTSKQNQMAQVLFIHNIMEVNRLRSLSPDSLSIRNISIFICPSFYISERLMSTKLGKRIEIIPHAVTSRDSKSLTKSPRILFVGRMVIEKGILNLLSSWSLVYESLPDYELHIYGDGPLSSAVLRIIQDSNLTERTIIHGEVSRDEIKEALISAEILIQPSLIPEAFGLSVLEAMSAGLPCIVTNKGALPELIQNDFNGLVVPPNHAAELAVAISRLASDTDLRKRLGASAKRKVRESFSSELIMTRYEELFESLI